MAPSPSATGRGPEATGVSTRRALLRFGLVSGLALTTAACSAPQREALLDVDPRQVRLDRARPAPPRPRPSARERRRVAVRAGAVAAVRAYAGAGPQLPPLRGRHGGAAAVDAAVAVHEAHQVLLGAGPRTPSDRFGAAAAGQDGPVLALPARPAAVLGTGRAVAVAAAVDERGAEDADVDLALLHARVAASRGAQAAALRGAGALGSVWPDEPAAAGVVDALQALLAQEHRARWSYGVVLAWAPDRADDAGAARADHTARVDVLTSLLAGSGASPVGALATYPTDDAGQAVDGPVTAGALALRLEDAVTTATAVVLRAAVATGEDAWVAAAVTSLAESERSRWSWGGAPVALPGG